MRKIRLATAAAALVAVVALGAGQAAAPSSLTLVAAVADQDCQPNGDFVDVTLSAVAESSSEVLGYKWDFTNDGRFDTPVLPSPTIVHTYPDEINVTARVGAKNAEGNKAMDTISFATLRCP
jgi:PKD domain